MLLSSEDVFSFWQSGFGLETIEKLTSRHLQHIIPRRNNERGTFYKIDATDHFSEKTRCDINLLSHYETEHRRNRSRNLGDIE